jgi:hypothetical protein
VAVYICGRGERVRVFAEAMRKALRAQIMRDPDLEIATIDTTQNTWDKLETKPAFSNVKTGDGVLIAPTPITANEEFTVWYGGLLAKDGASDIFLHYGIGPGAWQNVHDVRMNKESDGVFSCQVEAADGGRFEFCFRDTAGRWDNNNSRNWSLAIHNGLVH